MTQRPAALSPYRVLDLTTADGWLTGKLLADLGADVVKVEPPGGDPGRAAGPFAPGRDGDPEASLGWWAHNRGKRSVELDLGTAQGRSVLLELVADADVVLESYGPGALAAMGLDVASLLAANPALVVTSLSAFGADGPYAGHPVSDLAISALSGQMWLNGDADRPPVRLSVPHSFRIGAVEAAVHTMVALWHAARTGVGQHVDVSAQAAVVRTLMNATEFKVLHGTELVRVGSRVAYSPYGIRYVFACADGHVTFMPVPGPLGGSGLEWVRTMAKHDGLDVADVFGDFDVYDAGALVTLMMSGKLAEFIATVEAVCDAVFGARTKDELYSMAVAERYLLAPVNTVADMPHDRQLAARQYWHRVDHDGTAVRYPGEWAKLSGTPLASTARAPRAGEHTSVVLGGPARAPRAVRVGAPDPALAASKDPFAGLKVWDMSWVGVGPLTARYLADYGATVVRLDNTERADVLRVNPPSLGGETGINRSQFYADFNSSKVGIGLDITHPRGREVALKLVEWADVVTESFTPKTLAAVGLSYEHLRTVNPSLVMLSTCMQGQTGPHRDYRGFGQLMGALCGFYEVTGWPDRDPAMVYGAYTDFLCQRICATALVAALDHRRRTGEGQHIDVSQFEGALQYLAPELLDEALNGRVVTRRGNRDDVLAPHVVLACRPSGPAPQDERWVAVACGDDAQWAALVERLGRPAWATGASLATAAGRRGAQDRIEAELAAWAATRERDDVVRLLAGAVSVAPVLTPDELHDDAQLVHVGYFETLEHTVMGPQRYNGMQARLSVTPGWLRKAAPCLGEDTWSVLTEVLDYSDEDAAELLACGAVEINVG